MAVTHRRWIESSNIGLLGLCALLQRSAFNAVVTYFFYFFFFVLLLDSLCMECMWVMGYAKQGNHNENQEQKCPFKQRASTIYTCTCLSYGLFSSKCPQRALVWWIRGQHHAQVHRQNCPNRFLANKVDWLWIKLQLVRFSFASGFLFTSIEFSMLI